jgi:Flp pilus assembly pilin Flp
MSLFRVIMEVEEMFSMMVKKLLRTASLIRLDNRGQDMIEYALLAASIAVVVAGFLPPAVMPAVSTIFSKIISSFNAS